MGMTNVVEMKFGERAALAEDATWAERIRAAAVSASELDNMPEPEPLVGEVLYRDSIAWLYGPPASCKSFIALDLAACVGSGENWQAQGKAVRGPVLYVIAEGVSGIKARVRAWEAANGTRMDNVTFLPMAVQATHGAAWDGLVEYAHDLQPVLVVLDTQARVSVGIEENSAKEMGQFVQQIERLRQATGACVLVIHHTGRGGEHLRGSIAMDGAAATLIKVTRTEDIIEVECAKQKEAAEFEPVRLRLVAFDASAIVSLIDRLPPSTMDSPVIHRLLSDWWDSFETDWVSAKVICETTGTARATFFRHAKALERAALAETKGDGSAKRYRLLRNPGVSRVSPSLTPVSQPGPSTAVQSLTVSPPFRGETGETQGQAGGVRAPVEDQKSAAGTACGCPSPCHMECPRWGL